MALRKGKPSNYKQTWWSSKVEGKSPSYLGRGNTALAAAYQDRLFYVVSEEAEDLAPLAPSWLTARGLQSRSVARVVRGQWELTLSATT